MRGTVEFMSEEFFLTEKGVKVLKWERNIFYQTPGIKELFYKEKEILLANCDKTNVVLDVGCGIGTHLTLLSKYCKEAIGIDHSEAVLKNCREQVGAITNVKTFKMNAKKIEFPDDCFDRTICMFNTLGNMEDPLPVLREMCRVTKPGGKLIFSVYNSDSTEERLEFYHKTGLPDVYSDGAVIHNNRDFYSRSFTESEILKMCTGLGLELTVHKTKIARICEAVKNHQVKGYR